MWFGLALDTQRNCFHALIAWIVFHCWSLLVQVTVSLTRAIPSIPSLLLASILQEQWKCLVHLHFYLWMLSSDDFFLVSPSVLLFFIIIILARIPALFLAHYPDLTGNKQHSPISTYPWSAQFRLKSCCCLTLIRSSFFFSSHRMIYLAVWHVLSRSIVSSAALSIYCSYLYSICFVCLAYAVVRRYLLSRSSTTLFRLMYLPAVVFS